MLIKSGKILQYVDLLYAVCFLRLLHEFDTLFYNIMYSWLYVQYICPYIDFYIRCSLLIFADILLKLHIYTYVGMYKIQRMNELIIL